MFLSFEVVESGLESVDFAILELEQLFQIRASQSEITQQLGYLVP